MNVDDSTIIPRSEPFAPSEFSPVNYARAQVALMPVINRTVSFKQKAFTEVETIAKTHSVPVSDLLGWFQAATSL